MPVALKIPSLHLLPDYVRALERGWSPDNVRGKVAADEELERIAADPEGFVASLADSTGAGPPITGIDRVVRPRLPGPRRWIWDDGFCGTIGLRWSVNGDGLPGWFPYGHIGYAVPEWKRRRGYATAALSLILDEAQALGLTWVEITTDADNLASQAVVTRNGGTVWRRENGGPPYGGIAIIRWRITLASRPRWRH